MTKISLSFQTNSYLGSTSSDRTVLDLKLLKLGIINQKFVLEHVVRFVVQSCGCSISLEVKRK